MAFSIARASELLAPVLLALHTGAHTCSKCGELHRLSDELLRALFNGPHRQIDRAMSRKNDTAHGHSHIPDRRQELQSVAVGQMEIDNDYVGSLPLYHAVGGFQAGCFYNLVSFTL